MTWCDALLSRVWCFVFCKIFARWVYLYTHMTRCMTWHDMTWHDMTWHDMTWHDMTWHDMTWHDMTWHDMTWHDMTWHDMTCDALLSRVWCFVFCKIFSRWVYIYTHMTRCTKWHDALLSRVGCFVFCKIFSTRMRWHNAMRCSLEFDALYFVKYLQDGFTKAHAWDDIMRCVALSSLMLCIL